MIDFEQFLKEMPMLGHKVVFRVAGYQLRLFLHMLCVVIFKELTVMTTVLMANR